MVVPEGCLGHTVLTGRLVSGRHPNEQTDTQTNEPVYTKIVAIAYEAQRNSKTN